VFDLLQQGRIGFLQTIHGWDSIGARNDSKREEGEKSRTCGSQDSNVATFWLQGTAIISAPHNPLVTGRLVQ
jgi:hypothetical protein